MVNFTIHFFICNIFIAIMIGVIILAKHLFKKHLSSRLQYNLWFILLILLAAPFFKIKHIGILQSFSHLYDWNSSANHANSSLQTTSNLVSSNSSNWMNDLTISEGRSTTSIIGIVLLDIWLLGILFMVVFIAKSKVQLYRLKQSALPLQNQNVCKLYQTCLKEMGINRKIPIYSTAFLKSPIMAGFFRPQIYLPIHIISDNHITDLRYMILHELQHYKYKDALINSLMNLTSVVYWFNPLVWYSLKEMRNDREVACDTSVLHMLSEKDYEDYGNTLINFVEKVSLLPFPFSTGIGGNMAQIKKRIINIANYHPISFPKKLRSFFTFVLIAAFLLGFAPILTMQAADQDHYYFNDNNQNISYIDLSEDFNEYDGSFVLYDATADSWQIYNRDNATTRISPASTFKIYTALLGLESGIITPEKSQLSWEGQKYVYDTWNADQTLETAMKNSVTWYFQDIDQKVGLSSIKDYVHEIGYGNQIVREDTSSYWMNSSLKISPIEQVEILKKLFYNEFHFTPENINAVKNSIYLYSNAEGSLYGKTGTLEVRHQNTSGWFVGFIEKSDHIYFFATNIESKRNTTGPIASELTLSILSNLHLWESN